MSYMRKKPAIHDRVIYGAPPTGQLQEIPTAARRRAGLKRAAFLASWAAAGLSCLAARAAAGEPVRGGDARIRSAIVKITNISQRHDYHSPWKDQNFSKGAGSGVIIAGNRILTSAHVVSDSKYLQVEKEGRGTPYQAFISFIAHDCDLALLKVPDPNFFEDTTSLSFCTEMPALGEQVSLYGFPRGGSKISITRGIISRIEYMDYTHSAIDSHLAIQIDAAVNFGNSGGPAIYRDAILGIAFQSISSAENIGYLVPFRVIEHFFEDIRDGVYDGYPDLRMYYSNLINPAYRAYLEMAPGHSGVVVTQVIDGYSADGVIQIGDVLLEIGGWRIENDGTISIDDDSYRLEEVVERLQIGDCITFRILRGGEEETVELVLKGAASPMEGGNEYEIRPMYFVYGGMIFEPLSREYLKTWKGKWWNTANKLLLYKYMYYYQDELYRDCPVPIILTRVLPAETNSYFKGITNRVVAKINDRPIASLQDVIEAFGSPIRGYQVIEFEGNHAPCVLDAARLESANAEILRTYEISRDRYLGPEEKPAKTGGLSP